VTPKTRAVYLVNPHTRAEPWRHGALHRVRPGDVEANHRDRGRGLLEFEPDFAERTVAGLTARGENVIVFRTFGKLYGLAGLDVGYAIAPNRSPHP